MWLFTPNYWEDTNLFQKVFQFHMFFSPGCGVENRTYAGIMPLPRHALHASTLSGNSWSDSWPLPRQPGQTCECSVMLLLPIPRQAVQVMRVWGWTPLPRQKAQRPIGSANKCFPRPPHT